MASFDRYEFADRDESDFPPERSRVSTNRCSTRMCGCSDCSNCNPGGWREVEAEIEAEERGEPEPEEGPVVFTVSSAAIAKHPTLSLRAGDYQPAADEEVERGHL